MIVAFDANILVYLLDENAKPPIDLATGEPIAECKRRIEYLVSMLEQSRAKIIIPTPALAEVLVKAETAASEWLRILSSSKQFRIAPFDLRAAIEFAATQANRSSGQRAADQSRAKAKFDDQIIAISAVEGAETIYSDDKHIRAAAGTRFKVKGIADLPLPPEDAQMSLDLKRPGQADDTKPPD